MKALALPTLAQLSPAARVRRERRALRRDPYGLHLTVTEVDGRPIRSLSAGDIHDYHEVILLAGLGARATWPHGRGKAHNGLALASSTFLGGALDMRTPARRLWSPWP